MAFPLVLGGMSLGAGLLCERLSGTRLPDGLLLPAGLATLVLLGALALTWSPAGPLMAPLLLAAALAGFIAPLPGRRRVPALGPLWPALAVFGAFAAPAVAFGEPTILGFGRLDDPATFFTLLERVTTDGRGLGDLPRSSYRQTLGHFFDQGYPLGVLAPLGAGARVTGQDPMWVFAPYVAFCAGMLALVLAEIGRPLARTRAVGLAACAALLYGYGMWGGVKELCGAALVALGAALVPLAAAEWRRARAALPVAITCAALIDGLTAGALIWVAPLVVAWVVMGPLRTGGLRVPRRQALAAGALGVVLLVPAVAAASSFSGSRHITVAGADKLGTLAGALSPGQAFGIWPSRDFRFGPEHPVFTWVAIAVVAVMAGVGVAAAWRRARPELVIYLVATGCGAIALGVFASPWMAAKGLALVSPALVLAALCGVAVLLRTRLRAVGAAAGMVIGVGLAWSVALAYQGVTAAPRDRLQELERIAERIDGEGPTLTTEYSSYADRYILRDAAPEGPAEMRSRPIPLRVGGTLPRWSYADLDEMSPRAVLVYRTIVMRRSPVASRPPTVYRRIWAGDDYEVWQRAPGAGRRVIEHRGLGGPIAPAAVPQCAEVRRLAARARARGAVLVAAERENPAVAPAALSRHPASWDTGSLDSLVPTSAGELRMGLTVPRAGRYRLWLGGSFDRGFTATVDGRAAGSVSYEINPPGQYEPAGMVRLARGEHAVALHRSGLTLHPGTQSDQPLTDVALEPLGAPARLLRVPPANAGKLCGRALDWIDIVAP